MNAAAPNPGRAAARVAVVGLCAGWLAGCGPRATPPATPPGAERIVSLAPNLTEIVCAVGAADLLVGRSSACDYPPDIVARVPVAGDFGRPATERLLALRPTLVLAADLEDKSLPEGLRRAGIRFDVVNCRTLDDIPRAIREVGRLCGRGAEAEALAVRIERGIAERRAAADATARPVVYAELWHDPILTVGAGSFISEMIGLAGGRNLGDTVAREYFEASPEWVLAAAPDIILGLGMDGAADFEARLRARPGFAALRAVRERRIVTGIPPDLLLRPGPRVLEATDELKRRLAAAVERAAP